MADGCLRLYHSRVKVTCFLSKYEEERELVLAYNYSNVGKQMQKRNASTKPSKDGQLMYKACFLKASFTIVRGASFVFK
jgi:hypothetical protein